MRSRQDPHTSFTLKVLDEARISRCWEVIRVLGSEIQRCSAHIPAECRFLKHWMWGELVEVNRQVIWFAWVNVVSKSCVALLKPGELEDKRSFGERRGRARVDLYLSGFQRCIPFMNTEINKMKLLHIQPLSMSREYEKNAALVCVMMSNFNNLNWMLLLFLACVCISLCLRRKFNK